MIFERKQEMKSSHLSSNKSILISVFLLLCSFSHRVLAVDSVASTVASVRSTDWGFVIFVSGFNNGCGGTAIKISNNEVNKETIVSIALAAQMSGKKLKARYVTCVNTPWKNTASARDITLFTGS